MLVSIGEEESYICFLGWWFVLFFVHLVAVLYLDFSLLNHGILTAHVLKN